MCDCNKKIVDLSHLKIYTIMATYKAKLSSGRTYKGDFSISWATATQEELAYAYEEAGSEWMHDEYMHIVNKLCSYLDQNFDNDTKKPLECYIPTDGREGKEEVL